MKVFAYLLTMHSITKTFCTCFVDLESITTGFLTKNRHCYGSMMLTDSIQMEYNFRTEDVCCYVKLISY